VKVRAASTKIEASWEGGQSFQISAAYIMGGKEKIFCKICGEATERPRARQIGKKEGFRKKMCMMIREKSPVFWGPGTPGWRRENLN